MLNKKTVLFCRACFALLLTGLISISNPLTVFAQNQIAIGGEGFEVSIPSPNAASLGKVANIPVSLYTGTANIAIPLLTIQERDISIPISLSYHPSGIRVEEKGGWVGLGWSLNAGGVITRSVSSIPDDDSQFGYHLTGDELSKSSNYSVAGKFTSTFFSSIRDGHIDLQPDNFMINAPGISGKFLYTYDGPRLVPNNNSKIEKISNQSSNPNVDSDTDWRVITNTGIKYLFDKREISYDSVITSSTTIPLPPQYDSYISSWYLTEIESVDGNKVQFFYDQPNLTVHKNRQTQKKIDIMSSPGGCGEDSYRTHSYTKTEQILLKRIETSQFDYFFNTSLRSDAKNPETSASQEYKLDSIEKKTKGGVLVSKIEFQYSTFSSGRLKLVSVTTKDATGNNNLPPHTFEYFETHTLPDYLSHQIDHWGFYNGMSDNDAAGPNDKLPFLFDVRDATGAQHHFIDGIDRSPNFGYARTASLNKITYPTGAEAVFEYEPHTYGYIGTTTVNYDTTYTQSTIASENSGAHETRTKNFTIQGSVFGAVKANVNIVEGDGSPSCIICTDPYVKIYEQGNPGNSYLHVTASGNTQLDVTLPVGSYTLEVYGGNDDDLIGITVASADLEAIERQITSAESIVSGGIRIKKITQKDSPNDPNPIITEYEYVIDDLNNKSSGVLVTKPNYLYTYYESMPSCGTTLALGRMSGSTIPLQQTNGSHIGYKSVLERTSGNGYTHYEYTSPHDKPNADYGSYQDRYNLGPKTIREHDQGLLTRKRVYDESDNLLEEVLNVYSNAPTQATFNPSDYYPGITYKAITQINVTSGMGYIAPLLNTYDTPSFFSFLVNTKRKVFGSSNEDSKTIYDYDDWSHLQVTDKHEYNSLTSEYRKTSYVYAHEQYPAMATANMLAQPYSVLVEDGAGNDLSKTWTEWTSSSTISPGNKWRLWRNWQWKGGSASNPPSTANAVLTSQVTHYDDAGNILEGLDAKGQPITYDWSSNKRQLVGIVQGATKEQAFAHSFAYDGLTGWTIYNADGQDFDVSIDQGKLKLTNYASASNEELDRVYYDHGSEITGTVVVEFDVQMANSNNWDLIIAVGGNTWNHGNGGTETAVWSAINNESWRYYAGSWGTIVSGLEIGKTHAFKMVLNTTLNRVDFYVDGKKWVSNASFRQSSTGIQKIVFGSYGYGTTTTDWYIDNVRMYPEGAQAQSQETDPVFGTPLAIKDASGSTNRFDYDSFGRLTNSYNPNGERVSRNVYYYSLDGNSSYTTTDPNRVETITYNDPADTTDKTLSLTYLDGLGRGIQSQVRGGTEAILTETRYNERGLPEVASRPIKKTGVSGYVANLMGATFAPDPAVPATLPLPAASEVENYYDTVAPQDEEDYAYSYTQYEASPLARVEKSTLPGSTHKIGSGKEVETTYGLNTTETFTINGTTWGVNTLSKTVTTDPSGKETIVYTDGWGRTIVSGVNMNPGGDDILNKASSDLVTYFEYDLRGNLVRVEDPRGLATTYTWNQLGQLTSKKLPDQDYSVDYKYDEQGRLRFTQDPNQKSQKQDLSQSLSGSTAVTKTIVATGDGKLSLEFCWADLFMDSYNILIKRLEDGSTVYSNEVFSEGDCIGYPTALTFNVGPGTYEFKGDASDPSEPILSTSGTFGFISNDIYTYTKYDGLDRPTESGEYSGGTSFSAADPDADTFPTTGHTSNFQYYYDGDQAASGATNLQGRLTKVSYRDLSVATTSWGHTWYSYNTQGLVNSVEQDLPGLASKSIDYTYDELGRLTRQDYQAGQSDAFYQRYSYDAMGRLAKVETSTNGSSWIKDAEYTSYLADGNVGELKLGNSAVQTVDYTYTVQGWLDQVNGGVISGTDKFAMDLAYADNGNISSQQWRQSQISSGALATYTYSYDNANRLTAADFAGGTAYDVTYSYDKNGNLKGAARRNQSGSYAAAPFLMGIAAGSNRLTEIEDAVDVYTIGHDASGNMTSNPFNGLTSADYDWRNLPAQVIANSTTLQYAYDGDGNRVKKQVAGGTQTHYVRGAGGETIAMYEDGVLQFHNILAGADIIGTWDGTQRRYFLKDHLGSIRTTVDQSGNVDGYDDYYPFGLVMPNRSNNSANDTDNYKFTGHERDTEASLTLDYMMARNYDPVIGRFLQIDPRYDLYRGWTPYHYTLNNPLRYTDPTGECIKELPCPTLSDLGSGIAKTYNQAKGKVSQNVSDYVDYANSFDLSQGSEWGRLVADQIPLVNYEGGELSVDNPLEVASDAAEGVRTAGVNFVEGGADTKVQIIIGAVVTLAQYAVSKRSKVSKSKKVEPIGDFTKKTEVRPGKGPGQSRAEYVSVKNKDGKTIKTYKDSYDRAGKFQGRKPLRGGPEGRKQKE